MSVCECLCAYVRRPMCTRAGMYSCAQVPVCACTRMCVNACVWAYQ